MPSRSAMTACNCSSKAFLASALTFSTSPASINFLSSKFLTVSNAVRAACASSPSNAAHPAPNDHPFHYLYDHLFHPIDHPNKKNHQPS